MGLYYEFKIRQNLYKDVIKDDNTISSKLYRRNVTTRFTLYLSEIIGVEQIIGSNAKPLNGCCKLHIVNREPVTVNEPYIKIRDMVFNYKRNIGYK